MRAWGLRLLGPGSTLKTRDDAPIRFGDFQFEQMLSIVSIGENCGDIISAVVCLQI
jgi:hypothetical protein